METKPPTNPNKANQYKLDPRQALCWSLYISPESETFGNALQSALRAGYEQGTANIITTSTWFIEKLRRLNRAKRAEKNLEEVIEMDIKTMLDEKGLVRSELLKHRSEISSKILEITSEEWNPRKKIDITTKDEPITSINYIIPKKPDDLA